MRRTPAIGRRLAAMVVLAAVTLSSCAYYNTFYLARKYYDRATNGAPYVPEKPDGTQGANFSKSIEYSKKLSPPIPSRSGWTTLICSGRDR